MPPPCTLNTHVCVYVCRHGAGTRPQAEVERGEPVAGEIDGWTPDQMHSKASDLLPLPLESHCLVQLSLLGTRRWHSPTQLLLNGLSWVTPVL